MSPYGGLPSAISSAVIPEMEKEVDIIYNMNYSIKNKKS
jgi:hypothetical protein